MSEYTQMPPSLSERWVFPQWKQEDFFKGAPWEYRNFWYHDIDGEGRYLVFRWNETFDERDRLRVSGDIYRINELQKAVAFCSEIRKYADPESSGFVLDCGIGDGLCLRVPWTIYGAKLSYELIDSLWRE